MKLAVVGSRGFEDFEFLRRELDKLKPTEIISGGAKGADSLAARYAHENGIELTVFRPDDGKFGRGARHVRNRQIVDASDLVVAFWDGSSKGTSATLSYSKERGVLARVFRYEQCAGSQKQP